jgi:hypothetical protein
MHKRMYIMFDWCTILKMNFCAFGLRFDATTGLLLMLTFFFVSQSNFFFNRWINSEMGGTMMEGKEEGNSVRWEG